MRNLPLSEIAQQCREQQEQQIQHQGSSINPCYELFRRACEEQLQEAWQFILSIFSSRVRGWILQQKKNYAHDIDLESLCNDAFTRFWQANMPSDDAQSSNRFLRFRNIGSVLAYLKMCSQSALLDNIRKHKQDELWQDWADKDSIIEALISAEELSTDSMDVEILWSKIRDLLKDDAERVAIESRSIYDLRPRQIAAAYPNLYAPPNRDVYGVLENVMKRLRRNKDLAKWFRENFET